MTRDEFIRYTNEETGIPMCRLDEAIDIVTDAIVNAVEAGHDVKLIGFGSFKIKQKPKKRVTDPTTMTLPKEHRKMMVTAGGKKVVFEPGTRLMNAVEKA